MSELGKALVKYCDEFLLEKKQRMASRHEVFTRSLVLNSGTTVKAMCILKSYAALGTEDETKYVWEMHARQKDGGAISFDVKGPYEDSSDEYWLDMYKHDRAEGNGLVTPDYIHYTVIEDHANPGQGDGFGGQLFTIQVYTATAARLQRMGLKIEQCEDGTYLLHTRNLWQQGRIPKKHREHFKPNCKIL